MSQLVIVGPEKWWLKQNPAYYLLLGFFDIILKVKIKRKKENIFGQIFLSLFLFFLIFFFLFSNIKIASKRREISKKTEEVTLQLEKLKEKREKLESAILKAKEESYWEGLAREEGYIKEGEEAIVIKRQNNAEEIKKEEENKIYFNIFEKIKDFFQQ